MNAGPRYLTFWFFVRNASSSARWNGSRDFQGRGETRETWACFLFSTARHFHGAPPVFHAPLPCRKPRNRLHLALRQYGQSDSVSLCWFGDAIQTLDADGRLEIRSSFRAFPGKPARFTQWHSAGTQTFLCPSCRCALGLSARTMKVQVRVEVVPIKRRCRYVPRRCSRSPCVCESRLRFWIPPARCRCFCGDAVCLLDQRSRSSPGTDSLMNSQPLSE